MKKDDIRKLYGGDTFVEVLDTLDANAKETEALARWWDETGKNLYNSIKGRTNDNREMIFAGVKAMTEVQLKTLRG